MSLSRFIFIRYNSVLNLELNLYMFNISESMWHQKEFFVYFEPVRQSIIQRIKTGKILIGPEIVSEAGNVQFLTMYSHDWTYKKELSDSIIVLGVRDCQEVVSASFTKLTRSFYNQNLASSGWVAVREPGMKLGRETKKVRDLLLQMHADREQIRITHSVKDNNASRVENSGLSLHEKRLQRLKWEKLFGQGENLIFEGASLGNDDVGDPLFIFSQERMKYLLQIIYKN